MKPGQRSKLSRMTRLPLPCINYSLCSERFTLPERKPDGFVVTPARANRHRSRIVLGMVAFVTIATGSAIADVYLRNLFPFLDFTGFSGTYSNTQMSLRTHHAPKPRSGERTQPKSCLGFNRASSLCRLSGDACRRRDRRSALRRRASALRRNFFRRRGSSLVHARRLPCGSRLSPGC